MEAELHINMAEQEVPTRCNKKVQRRFKVTFLQLRRINLKNLS